MSFITHRQVQVLSFSGHSVKSRVVPDGHQFIHTYSHYTCMQSFIDTDEILIMHNASYGLQPCIMRYYAFTMWVLK